MFYYAYYLLLVDQFPATEKLAAQVASPTEYFWQIIATIFGGILLWLFKRDLDKRDRRADKMGEAINTLQTQNQIMQNDLDHIRTDLDQLLKDR